MGALTAREEQVWDSNRLRNIWVLYQGGLPVGNLRLIGKGPYADMEFRWADELTGRHAVIAPMAGATNPIEALECFAAKYLNIRQSIQSWEFLDGFKGGKRWLN